jgi:hypothetical protein
MKKKLLSRETIVRSIYLCPECKGIPRGGWIDDYGSYQCDRCKVCGDLGAIMEEKQTKKFRNKK